MPKIKNMNLIEAFKGIVANADSHLSVESYLSMAHRPPQFASIRQFIVFHKVPIFQTIQRKSADFRYFSLVNDSPVTFEVKIPGNRSRDSMNGVLAVLPGSQPNTSRVTTVSYSNFWNEVVKPLRRKLYPDGMPLFFRQEEIESALNDLEESLGKDFRVRIADVTSKEERFSNNQAVRKSYDTERRWTDLPIHDVFSQAKERGQWFTGLRFLIQKRKGNTDMYYQVGAGRLNKYGEVSFDSYYSEIASVLLNALEYSAVQRLELLEKRGIRERGYKPSKPIEISYDYDAFGRVEEVRRFGKIVFAYPNSTKAVFHSNPYYHASIADFLDGSSFDVWVLSSNRVVIVPQAKSSSQAFERLITHIFANFGEGVVSEFANQ